jgi:hypothetical protein
VTDTTKVATAAVNITTPAPPALADGTYVYNISGQDNNGNYFLAGAFAIKSGAITGGEQDFVDGANAYINTLNAANSNITLNNGAAVINLTVANNNNVGVNGVETLHGTMVSGSRLLITQFDNSASATGSLDLQTSTAAPSGGYAFMVNGADNDVPVGQLVIGGILSRSTAGRSQPQAASLTTTTAATYSRRRPSLPAASAHRTATVVSPSTWSPASRTTSRASSSPATSSATRFS